MISAVVLVKNNEKTLRNTLKSLDWLDEVIVYDNGSSDNSMNIAKSFSNVRLIQGEFNGFGWTKNKAASFAKNDWILSVDSDEVVDERLKKTLQHINLDQNCVYRLKSKSYYKNIYIKHSGWNKIKNKRLYNRKITSFNDNKVHESVICDGLKTKILDGYIEHYTYDNLSQFIQKADFYSTLFAQHYAHKKHSSPAKAFFNAFNSFFRTYFLKKGFLDGYIGLVIAVSHAVTNFFKYIKLYELNKNEFTHH